MLLATTWGSLHNSADKQASHKSIMACPKTLYCGCSAVLAGQMLAHTAHLLLPCCMGYLSGASHHSAVLQRCDTMTSEQADQAHVNHALQTVCLTQCCCGYRLRRQEGNP